MTLDHFDVAVWMNCVWPDPCTPVSQSCRGICSTHFPNLFQVVTNHRPPHYFSLQPSSNFQAAGRIGKYESRDYAKAFLNEKATCPDLRSSFFFLLHCYEYNDAVAEESKAVAQGAIPKGRGFEPHRGHFWLSRHEARAYQRRGKRATTFNYLSSVT